MPKSIKVSRTTISIDSNLMEKAQSHCESLGLKFSNYVEMMIDNDLELISDNAPISRLLEKTLPARAEQLIDMLGTADQKRILMRLLDALADFIEDFGPEAVDLMQKYQYTLEMHFHKPVKDPAFGPKKSTTSYSIEAHSDLKVAEDPPQK